MTMAKTRVLFLCTHNSARSQMAEGLLRHLAGDQFEVMSAGTEATHLRTEAIAEMGELGVDISGQESKTLERYLGERFDYVVTVCDAANGACPVFPGANSRLHWSFRTPRRLWKMRRSVSRCSRRCGTRSGAASRRSSYPPGEDLSSSDGCRRP